MSLTEIIKEFYANHPYIPLIALGISGGVGYIVGKIYNSSISHDSNSILRPKQVEDESQTQVPVMDDEDEYMPRLISNAVDSCEDSCIEGVIKEFYIMQYGYSGVIADSSGVVPFFINDEIIESCEDVALVPIIFNHSSNTQTELSMNGCYDDFAGIFVVQKLQYKMNGIDYEI